MARKFGRNPYSPSWPGFVPAIHVFLAAFRQVVDARVKPGHDDSMGAI
jgi:hypothetical protein